VTVHHFGAHAGFQRDTPVEDHRNDRQHQDKRGDQRDDRREGRFIDIGYGPSTTGRGNAIGRRHCRVVHRGHGEAQDQRAHHLAHVAEPPQVHAADPFARLKGEDGEHHGDDDRCREQRRVVAHQGVEPHRRHAGVVHRPDAGAHQRAADQQPGVVTTGRATTCRATPPPGWPVRSTGR
jgi:hypothetical protein